MRPELAAAIVLVVACEREAPRAPVAAPAPVALALAPTAAPSATLETPARARLASVRASPRAIAIDDEHVYWTECDDAVLGRCRSGSLVSIPKSGGTPITLADSQYEPWDVATADGSVFWTTLGDDSVWRLDRDRPGAAPQRIGRTRHSVIDLALDDTSVWVLDRDDSVPRPTSEVVAFPRSGGARRVLARGQGIFQGLAVGGGWVAWIDGEFRVWRAPARGGRAERVDGTEGARVIASDGGGIDVSCILGQGNRIVRADDGAPSVEVLDATAADQVALVGERWGVADELVRRGDLLYARLGIGPIATITIGRPPQLLPGSPRLLVDYAIDDRAAYVLGVDGLVVVPLVR